MSGGGEREIAVAVGVEAEAVHAPEQAVVAIELRGVVAAVAALPVGGAGHDEAMEMLQRAAAFAQLAGQPVEQLGMRRRAAHAAEVVRRIAQPAAEMVMPDAVRDAPPGQRIPVVRDPVGERGAALGFVLGMRQLEARRERRHRAQRAALRLAERLVEIAALEDVHDLGRRDRGRLSFADREQDLGALRGGVNHGGRGEFLRARRWRECAGRARPARGAAARSARRRVWSAPPAPVAEGRPRAPPAHPSRRA